MILKNKIQFTAFILLGGLTPLMDARAAPVIFSPYVSEGDTKLESKSEYNYEDGEQDDSWGTELSVSHGVASFWETELAIEGEDNGTDDFEATALAFENKFQLASPGTFWIDPGLKLSYAHSLTGEADEIKGQILLAKKTGAFLNKAQMGISKEVGDEASGKPAYNLDYGVLYDFTPTLKVGAEWYSDVGHFNGDFDDQEHRVGPVAQFDIGPVEFETGVLVGVSDAASDATMKLVMEYEF